MLHSIVDRLSNLPVLNGWAHKVNLLVSLRSIESFHSREVGFVPAGSAAAASLRARAIKDRIGFVRQVRKTQCEQLRVENLRNTYIERLSSSPSNRCELPALSRAGLFNLIVLGCAVRETLKYAAALRLPKSVDKKTQEIIVEQTIQGTLLNMLHR